MRLPKKGFVNIHRKEIQVVNIRDILNFVESNKLDGTSTITKDNLATAGLIKNTKTKVKLIMSNDSSITANVKISVDSYSEKAKAFSA